MGQPGQAGVAHVPAGKLERPRLADQFARVYLSIRRDGKAERSGGNGLADNVTGVRFMDPNPMNPDGHVNYGSTQSNGGWQSVNPDSGQSIPKTSPWWQFPLTPFIP